jgi:hypothetical protein
MDPLEQPPPNAPCPPPNKAAAKSRDKAFLIFGLGIVSMLVCIAIWVQPVVVRSHKAPTHTEALNNIRQVGMALFEFDSEYGSFPDTGTIAAVREATGTDLDLGSSSSNQIFRQLIAAGLKSERIFHCAGASPPARKPDNIVTKGKALEAGECSFGYVTGQTSTLDPGRPVVFGPLVPGTRRFDTAPFKGKAIILRLDNSATAMAIDAKTGQVMQNGMDIFDPRQPWWGGKAPDIKLPE